MWTFIEGSSPKGRTINIFEQTLRDQQLLWSVSGQVKPGDQLAAMEPSLEPRWLGEMMSILSTGEPLCPLEKPSLPAIPHSYLEKSISQGLILKGASVKITGATIVKTNCTGRMCDRREVNSQNDCGCYQMDCNAGKCHVMQADIAVMDALLPEPTVICNWPSLRMAEMGLTSTLPADINMDSCQVKLTYQKHFDKLFEHINASGGFDVTGWHRRGVATDASASGADNTQAIVEKATLHIEMITPSTVTRDMLESGGHLHNIDILTTRS